MAATRRVDGGWTRSHDENRLPGARHGAGHRRHSAFAQGEAFIEGGKRAFKGEGCYGCHTIGKSGTPIGPDLFHVGMRYPEAYLARWLRDPSAQRPNAHMPKVELGEEQIAALAAFLSSLG